MAIVILQDPHRPARATFGWDRIPGFAVPFIRVTLQYGNELHISALIQAEIRKALVTFFENLHSLGTPGSFEERVVRGRDNEFEVVCRNGSPGSVVCEVALAADWEDQRWRVQLRIELEISRLPQIAAQFREFFEQAPPNA